MVKKTNLKKLIIETLDNNKALDIVSIDLKDKSSIADHMIIASGTSSRHIQSLSEQVLDKFKENGFIELTKIAKNLGVENLGLRSLVALFLKHKISKKEQVSNWARKKLTNSQKKYAATDAWISRKLYIFLKEENLLSR